MLRMKRGNAVRSVRRYAGILAAVLSVMAIGIPAGCAAQESGGKGSPGGVAGTVSPPGEGIFVYVYPGGADPYGPHGVLLRLPVGPDGSFSIEMPPGEYILVARRRASLDSVGPLVAGDRRSRPVPVRIREGVMLPLGLVLETKKDAAVRTFTPPKEWTTALKGTVKAADGKPVEGARVHVFTTIQMSERPVHMSERTGPDGKYVVALPEGGTYFLAARDRSGGPPRAGDLYGRYGEGPVSPAAVKVESGGKKEGLDIVVYKVR